MAKYDFEALQRACEGQWAPIIKALSMPDVSEAIERKKHVKCPPGHGGTTNKQFRVFRDFDQTGGGICNTCGAFADGFALLTYLNGWDRKQAVKEVARYMEDRGYRPDKSVKSKPKAQTDKLNFEVSEGHQEALARVWAEGKPLKGTLGEKYLRSRGINGELPNTGDVRFHPRLHYWDADSEQSLGYFPALISLVKSSKGGHPLTIHRTYLDSNGGKANVPSPKKLMPCAIDGAMGTLGAAVRLYKLGEPVMAVTEGLENAMAIRSGQPNLSVWAALSAPVLTKFQPPFHIDTVYVFGDVDESGTGQVAAAKLALRLESERKYHARICLPRRKISLPSRDNGWYSGTQVEQIQSRLEKEGYEIVETCKSLDWLDAWNDSKDVLLEALKYRTSTTR